MNYFDYGVKMKPENKQTILLVDDEPFILTATSRILREAGYIVYTCELWAKVAGIVRHANPDLIMLDYNMPSLKGDDLCGILKHGSQNRRLKVVIFSSEDESFLKSMVAGCGADGYIPKGIPTKELLDRVKKFLPVAEPEPVKTRRDSKQPEKVMIVDDSPIVRRLCRQIVSQSYENCQVEEAKNGYDAIQIMSRQPDIDIVILDINMPGMNGYQFMEAIKRNPRISSSIIICSTEGNDGDVLNGLKNGANSYLIKPFTPGALVSVIEDVMLQRRSVRRIMDRGELRNGI